MEKRDLSGILLLDKATGVTSNRALQQVKRLFGARKAGHTGTLDPLATGMLPICFGEATKLSSFFLDSAKTYHAVARLGQVTNTADRDGEVIETHEIPVGLDVSSLERALQGFKGQIEQIPPMYSALKHQGKRLHELARAGQVVERKPRSVNISHLELSCGGQHLDEQSFAISVSCSKGTYIRTLVEDIGRALGCGAHILELRRTEVSPFFEAAMHRFSELESLAAAVDGRAAESNIDQLDRFLLPCGAGLDYLPQITLTEPEMGRFCHGNPVEVSLSRMSEVAADRIEHISEPAEAQAHGQGLARVYRSDQHLAGIATLTDLAADTAAGDSICVLKPKRVLNL